MVLENVRILWRDGHPANGITPKDPLQLGGVHVDELAIDPPGSATGVSADYYGMVLGKLSDFKVDSVQFGVLPRPNLAILLTFPYLSIPAEYNIEGQVNGVPAIGSGKLLNEVTEVAYNFTLVLGLADGATKLAIEELSFKYTVGSNDVKSLVALGDPLLNSIAENNFRAYTKKLYDELIPGQISEMRDAAEIILTSILEGGSSPVNIHDTVTSLYFAKRMIYLIRTTLHL